MRIDSSCHDGSMSDRTAPLSGLRVLDLTHVLAGPYCTYQLALLGADVVKVEPLRGDMVRTWGGTEEQIAMGLGTGFVAQNAAKRSLAVDLSRPDGLEIVSRLADDADVLIENYRPSTIERLGLGYEAVAARNPRIIYASISAFGRNGPHADRPGFDDVVQATSGYMSLSVRGDGPLRTGGPVLDYAAGMHATSAILAAVLMRQQSGTGHHIDVAMQDVAMLLVNRNTHIAATTGTPPPPAANRDGLLLGRYETADGYLMLAGYRPRHWRSILRALGLDELAELPTREIIARTEEIDAVAERRIREHDSAHWDDVFHRTDTVGGGARSPDEVLDTGQPDARRLLVDVDSEAGCTRVTTAGYLVDDEPFAPSFGPPTLGGNNAEILRELGYPESRIEQLVRDGVIGSPPG